MLKSEYMWSQGVMIYMYAQLQVAVAVTMALAAVAGGTLLSVLDRIAQVAVASSKGLAVLSR